jgi:predicted CxxxxCH...CXXCH cytochrome family protein
MKRNYRRMAWAIAVAAFIIGGCFGVAQADHSGGNDCYSCHALNANDVQLGTKNLNIATMGESRTHGWTPGKRIGCTYCHRSVSATASMPDVLGSFAGATPNGASRHPVSRNYVTGAIDNTPYLSNDNVSTANHLDCKDCHDITLTTVPDHDNTTWLNNSGAAGRTKSTNPFGLRSVTSPKAYDDLCRNCHRSEAAFLAFTGKSAVGASKIVLAAHDNGADNTVNAIRDLDNTQLRTQSSWAAKRQCTICHDAHESQNLHMFSDGHERDAGGSPETPIDERADCTTVCHLRGDAVGNYDLHGHGKPQAFDNVSLARDCDLCHDVNQPHRPQDTNYFVKYRFEPYDLSWNSPSVFGKPTKGVCGNCHGNKPTHKTARGEVGCVDCHDQHAKASDNNVMMIRSTNRVAGSMIGISGIGAAPGSESVLFQRSAKYPLGGVYHYWTNTTYSVSGDATNAGFCDQRACHGNRVAGSIYPLSTFLTGGLHSGGNQSVNSNCEGCHAHGDTGGSFRASSVCTNCHGQPPPPQDSSPGGVYIYNEFLSPHRVHAGNNQASGYYAFDCRTCHYNYADSATHNTTPKTFQSLIFDNDIKRGLAGYDNGTLVCSNIYCHSDGKGGNPNTPPKWFDPSSPTTPQTLTCNGCHSMAMSSGSHTAHLALNFTCSSCHYSTITDNNQVLNPTSGMTYHVNKAVDVAIKPVFAADGYPSGHYDNATKTCSTLTCHGVPIVWGTPPSLTCDGCHSYNAGVPVATPVYDYSFDNGTGLMSKVVLSNFQNRGHGDTNGLAWDATKVPALVCASCHDSGVVHNVPTNPFRLRTVVSGRAVAPDNVNTLCIACHTDYLTRSAEHSKAVTGGGQLNWGHVQKCVDCHDVHGQNNLFMIFDNLAWRSDNVTYSNSNGYGIPLFPASRVPVSFIDNNSGGGFASATADGNYFDGICEACHVRTHQFANGTGAGTVSAAGHPSRGCLECHPHRNGFAGFGGNNIEQFFDNGIRAASGSNYNDRSGHPIAEALLAGALTYPAEGDCYACHGVSPLPSTYKSNECLKCHYEKRAGLPMPGGYHPNGIYEWAVPVTPATPFGATGPASDAFCLQCHGGGASGSTLGGVSPTNVIPLGESWTGPVPAASGHGSLAPLSDNVATVGPPAYTCRACHYSSVPVGSTALRDNNAPTFHASLNRKMVGNENAAIHEYPHPSDSDARYNTVDEQSIQMDWFCAAKCHGNLTNADTKDDGVVKHTWDLKLLQSQSGFQTHPSDMAPVPSAKFRSPDNLPLSNSLVAAPPAGTGNEVCVTCHNPHGGGALLNQVGASITGGNKQMMRRSFSDNGSTICKECHL